MKAQFIKDVSEDWQGTAYLFKVDPPMKYDEPWDDSDPPAKETEYVVASAVVAMMTGAETYIFATDAEGNVIDWGELEGSGRGFLDPDQAIRNAGYNVLREE